MVRELLLIGSDLEPEIQVLLRGGSIEKVIDENVVVRDLRGDKIWSFLLFSGYLSATSVRREETTLYATLTLPNREVAGLWRGTFREWLLSAAGAVEPLHLAVLAGEADKVQEILSKMLLRNASFHDVADDQDEAFYHAFVLGPLVSTEPTHYVRSNREAGRGRADVLIVPRQAGRPGAVLEFKKQNDKRSLFAHAGLALRQIQQQGYGAELEAAGAAPIRRLGIAFSGKQGVVSG
jgi:PD-(D/E)XK nuclease superfamily